MNEQHSNWQTKELAKIFSEGVRGAIPGANLQLEIIEEIIRAWCPLPSRILDLGCGDGIIGRMLLDAFPAVKLVFADFSEPMLAKLRNKLAGNERAAVINVDFGTTQWTRNVQLDKSFDIIVSGFAIHHQPHDRKKTLYAEIYGLLNEGGLFLNLDQVSSATPSISKIFDSFFLGHMRRFVSNGGSDQAMKEIEKAYYQDKNENIPAPVDAQCRWLRDIGFREVDCFFRTFELALFGGRKISNKDGSV